MMRKFAKRKIVVKQASQQFNVKTFDYNKDPSQSRSSLQFISLLLTKHFCLKVQEALGMLIDQSTLLAKTIIQGTRRGGFYKIQCFYQDLLQNIDSFSALLDQEPQNVKFIMNSIRCGFFSGSYDVAEKTIIVVKRAGLKDWLVDIDKAKSVFLGLERHPSLSQQFLALISSFFGANLIGLIKQNFATGMKKNFNLFMSYAKQLISYMRSSLYRKQFLESGVLEQLLEIVLRNLQPDTIDTNTRMRSLNLLTELLISQDFIKNLRYSTTIRRTFQTAESVLPTLFSKLELCNNLFRLLQNSIEKHLQTNIKLFFHILCHLLNCQNQEIFQFVIENIKVIIAKYTIVPIVDFLETAVELQSLHPMFVKIFAEFIGRSEGQKELRMVGEVMLMKYEKGVERSIFGNLLVSIIKANYQNSSDLIMYTVRTLLTIYCQYLGNPGQKPKRPIFKNKDPSEVLTQEQQQQIIRLQYVHNTVEILLKLLRIVKQIHHQQVFLIIQGFQSQLRKKKGNSKQLQKFMRALAQRQITEEDQDQQQIKNIVSSSRKKQTLSQRTKKIESSRVIDSQVMDILEQQSEEEKSKIEKQQSEANRQQVQESNEDLLQKLGISKQLEQGRSEWVQQSEQNIQQQHTPTIEKKQQASQKLLQNDSQNFPVQKRAKITPILPHIIFDPSFIKQKNKGVSQRKVIPFQLSHQEKLYLQQFSQQPVNQLKMPQVPQLEDHELLFISHVKQVHKLKFQYLMLLLHQQGMDKFSSEYSLETFFGKRYQYLSKELLEKKDLSVEEFADILIINSLRSPGVNRMMGILRMLQYFKKQTIKIKGNIRVFEDVDKGLQKLVEEKDGFKQTKLRSVDYIASLKNKSVPQKYKICYQIVNQILLKKFNAGSIQHMIKITDTMSAEEVSEKKQKSRSNAENHNQSENMVAKLPASILDQQRKDKISARIKMLEKQSKPKS